MPVITLLAVLLLRLRGSAFASSLASIPRKIRVHEIQMEPLP